MRYVALLYLGHMQRIILCFTFLAFCLSINGQGVISTDRPNQTYAVTVEGKGSVIVETGLFFNTVNGSEKIKTNDYAQTFVRIGTGANLEVQLGTAYRTDDSPSGGNTDGLMPLKVGTKIRLVEEKGPWPAMAFVGNVTLPWMGKEEFRPEYVAPDFRFIFNHTLSDRFSLAYNLGMQWDGVSPKSSFLYTLLLSAGIVGDLGGYVEIFGDFPEGSASDHAFDLGLTYLINPNIQVDVSYGNTYTSPTGYYFNVGGAFRFGNSASQN